MPGEIDGNIKPLIPDQSGISIDKKIKESQYKEKLAELSKSDSRVSNPSKKSFLEQLGSKISTEKPEESKTPTEIKPTKPGTATVGQDGSNTIAAQQSQTLSY